MGLGIMLTPDAWQDVQDRVTALEAGGSGETTVVLGSDFTNSTTTATDSPLAFTPAANKTYAWEALLFLETAVTTSGVRPGIKEPTAGLDAYAGNGYIPNSQSSNALKALGDSPSTSINSTGYSYADEPFYGKIEGLLKTGSSPVGDLIVTLKSENTDTVKILAGSTLIYKELS